MAHTDFCNCGHHANRHADLDIWHGWGMGNCSLCKCQKFECPECVKVRNNKLDSVRNDETANQSA